MEIKFREYSDCLKIDRLEKLKIISLKDFGLNYQSKINFPPGAHEISVIIGKNDNFRNISEFFIHVCSIPHARGLDYDLPSGFYDQRCVFNPLSKSDFDRYINSYFEGFFEHLYPVDPSLNMWKVILNIEDFTEGYYVEALGTEQILACTTPVYYLYFISQSIDQLLSEKQRTILKCYILQSFRRHHIVKNYTGNELSTSSTYPRLRL